MQTKSKVIPILPSLLEKAPNLDLVRVLSVLHEGAAWPSEADLRAAEEILAELEKRYLKSLESGYDEK